jgi:hypothetical protein
VRAVAQIGTTIYVGGGFTSVGYGSGTIARSHLVALDATTGLHVPGFDPRADDDVNALLRSPDGTRLYAGGCSQRPRLHQLRPAGRGQRHHRGRRRDRLPDHRRRRRVHLRHGP